MAFHDRITLSRQKLELFYSIFLLIVIPVALVANTLLTVNNARDDFSIELRRKADLANEILGASVKDNFTDISRLQRLIEQVVDSSEEITQASVIGYSNGTYSTLASSDLSAINQPANDIQAGLVVGQGRSIAALVTADNNARAWRVLTPISGDNGVVLGVVRSEVSLAASDALAQATYRRSLFMLAATMVVVILLLLNHFRFVEYASLFKKLKELDQMKNDFIQVATHELRAPITAIKGNLSNALDELPKSTNKLARQSFDEVMRQIDRLNSLIDDLLNVARLEQNRTSFDMQKTDLEPLLQRLQKQFETKAKLKGLTITYQSLETSTNVYADPDRLEEVFTNLIDNAIKYSREGSVTIKHTIKKDSLTTSVKDTGIGISAQERERLFKRFARIRNEKTQNISGTGLGLWITKEYVEKMGGHIFVDSLEDVGSEFTVELPLTKEN